MKDHIALYLPSLNPGGVQRVMLNLARGLGAAGWRVDMVLARAEGPFLKQLPGGVRLVDLGGHAVLASLPTLIGYLQREKPRAVLSAQPHCNLVAIWARMLSSSSTRIVISEHNTRLTAAEHAYPVKEKLIPWLMRRFYQRADSIVTVSQGVAEDIARITRLPPGRFHVIYNPIVFPEMQTLAAADIDHPWFRAGQPPVILAVGRLARQKDHITLLKAFAHLHQLLPIRLIILGEGEKRLELEKLAGQLGIDTDVELAGYVENPFAFMAHCAVFVLSSQWEGFGNVLVEAMACGAQVVSTDCPSGPAEILEGGRYGRLAPVGNAAALAAAVQTALEHPLPVEQVRARANIFSIHAAAEKYLRLLTGEQHA